MLVVLLLEAVVIVIAGSAADTAGSGRPMVVVVLLLGIAVGMAPGRYVVLDSVGCNECSGQWGTEGSGTEG